MNADRNVQKRSLKVPATVSITLQKTLPDKLRRIPVMASITYQCSICLVLAIAPTSQLKSWVLLSIKFIEI